MRKIASMKCRACAKKGCKMATPGTMQDQMRLQDSSYHGRPSGVAASKDFQGWPSPSQCSSSSTLCEVLISSTHGETSSAMLGFPLLVHHEGLIRAHADELQTASGVASKNSSQLQDTGSLLANALSCSGQERAIAVLARTNSFFGGILLQQVVQLAHGHQGSVYRRQVLACTQR